MRRGLRLACVSGLGVALALLLWWSLRGPREHPPGAPATLGGGAALAAPDHAFAPGPPPTLLPPRAPGAGPALAWERLLAADGSPLDDLSALGELSTAYFQAGPAPGGQRLSPGFNEDWVTALQDAEALGESALPASHPALRDGRLIDRWGTPWQVHPLALDQVQWRSAGPDRRLYTEDDLVAPADGAKDAD